MEVVEQEKSKAFTDSQVTLVNRSKLTVTGVEKVFETNENKVQLKVSDSNLLITGEGLNIARLDVESGVVQIDGLVNELKYQTGENKGNFFKKIFK